MGISVRFFFEHNLALRYFNDWSILLLDVSIRTTTILAVCATVLKLLKRQSAALRHFILVLALSSAAVLPVLGSVVPGWQVPIPLRLEPMAITNKVSHFLSRRETGTPINTGATFENQVTFEPDWPSRLFERFGFSRLVVTLWLAGFVLLMSRLIVGIWSVSRIQRRASRVVDRVWVSLALETSRQLGLTRSVQLLKSREVSVPLACGLFRPAVLVPVTSEKWASGRCKAVLRHEFAHIQRRDCQTQMLAQAVGALYWFNPFVWWAVKQMRIERELACDDQVVSGGTKAADYANHLVQIARAFGVGKPASLASVGLACSQVEARVRSILDPGVNRRSLHRRSVIPAILLMGAGALFVGAIEPGSNVASINNEAMRFEADQMPTRKIDFVGTESKNEFQRHRKPAITRLQVVATDGKATAKQLMAASNTEKRSRVAVSTNSTSGSNSSSSSLSTSAITPGTTYAITRTEVTVTHRSDRGFGIGLGQGVGRVPD